MHELGDGGRTDRADVARLIADRVEHRLVRVERRLVATDPDRKLAARRALRTAGHRRVEHVRALLGERRGEFFDKTLRIGREIEPGRAALDAREKAIGRKRDLFDVERLRQRGQHHIGLLGDGARRVGPHGAGGDVRCGGIFPQVVDDQLVAGLLKVGRHAGAHGAEPDKTDLHGYLPRSSRPVQARQDRLAHHPVLILLGEEAQLLGEVLDALPIGRFRQRVGQIGPPITAPRAEGVEAALQVLRHVAERISLL